MSTKANKLCQGKDVFERMNFLYQASKQFAGENNALAAYYGQMLQSISKKAVLRLAPDIKRSLCKRCGIVLVVGASASLDLLSEQNNKTKTCQIECLHCHCIKRFVLNKDYNICLDNETAVKETIVFDGTK